MLTHISRLEMNGHVEVEWIIFQQGLHPFQRNNVIFLQSTSCYTELCTRLSDKSIISLLDNYRLLLIDT